MFGMSGMPNWRKNFSIGLLSAEAGRIAAVRSTRGPVVRCSIFTRTEITAGFTRSIRSAKPARRTARSRPRGAGVPLSVDGW